MADPRQTLQDLIRRFGTSLAGEPQRCKGMLMDLCGSSRREIAGLVVAIEEKITTELMKPHPIVVSLRANMILRLVNNRGLDHELAVWTVDTWGLVLGTWTQADLDSFSPIPPQRQAVTTPPQQRTETVIPLAGVVVEPPQLDRSQELLLTATERQTGTKKTVVLDNGKRLKVTIPAGMKIGQKLLLSGQGAVDPVTGAVGDTYLLVQERSEPPQPSPAPQVTPPPPRQAQWNIDQVPLESEKRANYTTLRDLLKAQKWKEADQETYRLMITIVGRKEGDWFRQEDLLNFPCKDLKTIDRLWVQASLGRYGFSVQKEIYVHCGGKLDGNYPSDEIWNKFGTEVGWRVNNLWQEYDDLTWNSIYVPGHLPNLWGYCYGGWGSLVTGVSLFSHTNL